MMRQLIMQDVVGAPFDWTLAASDFARAWAHSALAAHRRAAPPPANTQAAHQRDLWPGEVLDASPAPWKPRPADRAWTAAPRPTSIPGRRLSRRELAAANARLQLAEEADADEEPLPERPATRAGCATVPRPCPFVSCRHHLYLEVSEQGWLKVNWPGLDVLEVEESCSLDVADRAEADAEGGVTLEELGSLFNISLEGARQVELDVLAELRTKLGEDEVRAILEKREDGDDD